MPSLLPSSSHRPCRHVVVLQRWKRRPRSLMIGLWSWGHILPVPRHEGCVRSYARTGVVLPLASRIWRAIEANLFIFSWRTTIRSSDDHTSSVFQKKLAFRLGVRVVHGTSPSERPGGPLVRPLRVRGGPLWVNLGLTTRKVKTVLPCPPSMPRV